MFSLDPMMQANIVGGRQVSASDDWHIVGQSGKIFRSESFGQNTSLRARACGARIRASRRRWFFHSARNVLKRMADARSVLHKLDG